MIELSPGLIDKLRAMASTGAAVPELLKEIIPAIPRNQSRTFCLIWYLREAFHLPLRAVTPLGGWDESGKGEITDDRIEELLRPEMERTRALWEMRKQSQEGDPCWHCPLLDRDIAEGLCLDINYELLNIAALGLIAEIRQETGKSAEEVSSTCEACPNQPLREE
jgi:hypothetical protein